MEKDIPPQNTLSASDMPPASTPLEQSKPSKKKYYIILGGIVLILFLLLLSVFYSTNKQTPLTSNKNQIVIAHPTKVPVTVAPQITVTPGKPIAPKNWYIIHTQYYSVTVPQGWKPTVQTMQGGVAVMISPNKAPEDPLLIVESYDGPVSIASKIAIFQAEGLAQSHPTVSNNQAQMVTGTWSSRTINGVTYITPTQERIVFVPHNNSAFVIRMYYSSSKPDPIYDGILQRVLGSFTAAS